LTKRKGLAVKKPLVRLTSIRQDNPVPCFIDPDSVTGIVDSGIQGVSRIDRGNEPCVYVLGTPENVYAELFQNS